MATPYPYNARSSRSSCTESIKYGPPPTNYNPRKVACHRLREFCSITQETWHKSTRNCLTSREPVQLARESVGSLHSDWVFPIAALLDKIWA